MYALWGAKDLVLGVRIKDVKIESAKEESEGNVRQISGNARNAINLLLNGREISIDKGGNFAETIVLLSGYNLVSIEAEDKFGNKDEEIYQLTYSPNAEVN